MRIGKRFAGGVALMATAALTLAACGSGAGEDPAAAPEEGLTGEINSGVAYETTDYSSITTSALAFGSNLQVLEGLYQLDMATYEPFPGLANGDPVAVSDTVYEITLREGAKFSDGSDVTIEDVLSSYERTTAEGSIYRQFFDFVKSVAAKDDKTITVELNYPFPGIASRFADVKIVPTSMTTEELQAKPIGSGPYKYESITPTEVTAVPNEYYNGDHQQRCPCCVGTSSRMTRPAWPQPSTAPSTLWKLCPHRQPSSWKQLAGQLKPCPATATPS